MSSRPAVFRGAPQDVINMPFWAYRDVSCSIEEYTDDINCQVQTKLCLLNDIYVYTFINTVKALPLIYTHTTHVPA